MSILPLIDNSSIPIIIVEPFRIVADSRPKEYATSAHRSASLHMRLLHPPSQYRHPT
jgi:hypothetical protein